MTPYKGYTATVWFEPDDRLFHGTADGIRHIIHFAGRSVDELEEAFRDSVDDYLAWAEEDGFEPQRPTLTERIEEPERLVRAAAEADRQPVARWIDETLTRAARETLRRAG